MKYDAELLSRIVLKDRIDDHDARLERIEYLIDKYGVKPDHEHEEIEDDETD